MNDQNAVRQHVVVFPNHTAIRDQRTQSDSLELDAEVFVMQARHGIETQGFII